jgi:hypothetical protein
MSLTLIRRVSSVMVYAQCATYWQFKTKLLKERGERSRRGANFKATAKKKRSDLGVVVVILSKASVTHRPG